MRTVLFSLLAGTAIMRQAPEAEGNAASATETAKRTQRSERAFIDATGAVVDKIEEATGMRYDLLDKSAPDGRHRFDYQCGPVGNVLTMAAIFGLQTKIGNVANTVLNDKDEPGSPGDAAAAIQEWLGQDATAFVWAERAGGVGGARVDKDALAGAIVTVAEASPAWQTLVAAANGDVEIARGNLYDKVRARLESEPAYMRSARGVPDVAAEYTRRVGKQSKSIGDLL